MSVACTGYTFDDPRVATAMLRALNDSVGRAKLIRLAKLAVNTPPAQLDARVEELADRMAGVPINQLVMQKLMINQAYDNMGLSGTQLLATVFDGIARHSPEGRWFKDFAEEHGFHAAVEWRDSGRPIPEGGAPVPDNPGSS